MQVGKPYNKPPQSGWSLRVVLWAVVFTSATGCKDGASFSSGGGKKHPDATPEVISPRAQGATQPSPTPVAGCYQGKLKTYNLTFVFDSSSSMRREDPAFARAQGAHFLVDRLAHLSSQHVGTEFKVSMVRFADDAMQGQYGWMPLNLQSLTKIQQEIQLITANPQGGTSYVAGLRATADLLARIQAGNDDTRNFVLFLTDGDPADAPSAIQAELEQLTRNFNAVIIAIAVGQSLSSQGIAQVQSMALPRSPLGSDPRHVGAFHRVLQASQLSGIFDQIFQSNFACIQ